MSLPDRVIQTRNAEDIDDIGVRFGQSLECDEKKFVVMEVAKFVKDKPEGKPLVAIMTLETFSQFLSDALEKATLVWPERFTLLKQVVGEKH